MDEKMIFGMIKNVIIEQNKLFLKDLCQRFKLDEDYIMRKYLTPDYYLPIVDWAQRRD